VVLFRKSGIAAAMAGLVLLAGCGVQRPGSSAVPDATAGVTGRVHGGQQAVGGSTIQLYTVGTTGDGSSSTALLTQTVTTDGNGNFNLTGLYSCTSATLVYITATGGDPTPTTTNPNLAMMTALGACTGLTSGTFISINEVTTVAAVAALSPYMTSATAVGSGTSDVAALTAAFATAAAYADPSLGVTPGPDVPAGMAAPSSEINTLADILAACVNSTGGASGDNSSCGNLFLLTKPTNGTAATNTVMALLNLANNPTLNTSSLFGLASSSGPFQPGLTVSPSNFQVGLTPELGSEALTISPAYLIFSGGSEGYPLTAQTATILNSGTGAVTLSSIGIDGSDATDFSKTTTCGSTLAQGTSCYVYVTFTPVGIGLRLADLQVSSSAPGSPQYVPLSGLGIASSAGPVSLSTSSLLMTDFAEGVVNLTNQGTLPLAIASISASSGFSETNNCGTVLAASALCSIVVTPPYSILPPFTGTLSIVDNASPSPQTVALTSTLDPVMEFGSAMVGTLSLVKYSFNVTGYTSVSVSGPDAGDFGASNYYYESEGYSTITVSFLPGALGSREAVLTTGSTKEVLTGTGAAAGPLATFVPSGYDIVVQGYDELVGGLEPGPQFGTQLEVGYIYNAGNTALQFSGSPTITFSGTNASEFTLVANTCTTLAVGAKCLVNFNFSPLDYGLRQATLNVTDAISGTTFQNPLSVTATSPYPAVSTSTLTFPETVVGQTSVLTLTISSVGEAAGDALSILALEGFDPSQFSASPTSCPAPATSCVITINYLPTGSGSGSAVLYVYDSTSKLTTNVSLSGTAEP